MKKRRILVSLALASAALFSLAACGKTESTPTPTPAPTSAAPAPATSSTPAASSSVQAADKVTVKYIAKYSDGAADEELTALATQIDKNTKATAPAENPTKDGYVFKGFKNKTTHLPFDFNANITKNTDIVAYFYKPGTYDEIAASDDAVMAYDFDDAAIGAKIPAYDANVTGLSNDKEADAETYGATVVVKDYHNMLKTYDLGSGQTKVLFNIKDAITNSKVTIYAKFKLDGTMGSKWPFIEVLTDNGTSTVAAYGFGGDSNKKIGYRLGSNETYENYKDELLEVDKEYNALFEIDTDAKTIKLTLNGEAFDPVSADFDNIAGVKFVTGGSAGTYTNHSDERFILIDQFAVKAEANDIATVKSGAKSIVKDAYDGFLATDKTAEIDDTDWASVKTAYENAYNENGTIDAATDAAGVKAARDAAITAIGTAVNALRTAKLAELKTAITSWSFAVDTEANTKYAALSSVDKADSDAELAKLKEKYTKDVDGVIYTAKNIKEGFEILDQFVADARACCGERAVITVKYYKYVYTEATGLTSWAENTEYFTKAEFEYVLVDQTKVTAPASGVKYYTRTISSYGAEKDKTFKAIKGFTTSISKVEKVDDFFVNSAYTDDKLTTLFDFDNTKINQDTTLHVLISNVAKWSKTDYNGHANDEAIPDNYKIAEICKIVNTSSSKYAKNKTSKVDGVQTTNCIGFSFEKGRGCLQIDVKEGFTATINVIIGSDGSSNTTDKIYLTNITTSTPEVVKTGIVLNKDSADSTSTFDSSTGEIKVKGTDGKTSLTLTLSAGTYKLGDSSDSSKALRIQGVTVELNVSE